MRVPPSTHGADDARGSPSPKLPLKMPCFCVPNEGGHQGSSRRMTWTWMGCCAGYGGDLSPDPDCVFVNTLIAVQSVCSLLVAYSLLGVVYARWEGSGPHRVSRCVRLGLCSVVMEGTRGRSGRAVSCRLPLLSCTPLQGCALACGRPCGHKLGPMLQCVLYPCHLRGESGCCPVSSAFQIRFPHEARVHHALQHYAGAE